MHIDRVKLIAEMARQRMTVKQLAEMSGVSCPTVTNIRSGKSCSPLVGKALARALGVDPEELMKTEMEAST